MKRLLILPVAAALAFGLANPSAALADTHVNPCGDIPSDNIASAPFGLACWTGGQEGRFAVYDGAGDGRNVEVIGKWTGGHSDSVQTHRGWTWGNVTEFHGPFPHGTHITVIVAYADGTDQHSINITV